MTWIKLDNRAVDHPKVASLTDRAFRWWVRGLSYASAFLTDGVLPPVFWKQTPKQIRAELSDGHLWDWVDPNFEIHDYLAHQSSREAVDRKKAATADRVKRYRERNAVTDQKGNGVSNGVGNTRVTPPDTENRDQIQSTETTTTSSLPPPLIHGESNPRTWGKIHGEHIPGFCDWVCLPEFIFAEFARKSAREDASDYVRSWASSVRGRFQGQAIGDNLKFWRDRWAESHAPIKLKAAQDDAELDAALQAVIDREAAKKKAVGR